MIKALFEHGVERDMLRENPCRKIKFYPISKKKKYIPPKEDIQKVLQAASPKDRRYLLVIIHTLARVNEINNLKWEDVYDDYLILRTRKAKNSDLTERKVAINDTLKEVIKGVPKIGEYVFCYTSTKKPYLRRLKTLKAACKKAGVKEFGFHALRHYGASKLASEGVPLTDIQVILGHQKVTTTSIYLQSISPSLKKAMDKIGIESPI
jgi:integrase